MKVIISPTFSNPRKLRQLKRHLSRNGIHTEIETPERGHLGRGIATGLATILAGGDGFFTKIGEAIVKYVELKKVDVTMKNTRGEEITLSAALPKDEIRDMVNEFFGRKIANGPKAKNVTKKTPPKKTPVKKTPVKKTTEKKNVIAPSEKKKAIKK
ncbi:MAG: hypothetical protein JXL97_16795 [Bacteroidales bacterium]|nr:hypothetical protein [Bacteroidales bacterium]